MSACCDVETGWNEILIEHRNARGIAHHLRNPDSGKAIAILTAKKNAERFAPDCHSFLVVTKIFVSEHPGLGDIPRRWQRTGDATLRDRDVAGSGARFGEAKIDIECRLVGGKLIGNSARVRDVIRAG